MYIISRHSFFSFGLSEIGSEGWLEVRYRVPGRVMFILSFSLRSGQGLLRLREVIL